MADEPFARIIRNEQQALIEFEAAGHKPKLTKDGKADEFALDIDPTPDDSRGHNGFMCTVCWDTICVHCWAMGSETVSACEGEQ